MNVGKFFEYMRRVCCRVCLVNGPIFIALALGFGIYTGMFLHRSVSVDGTVVRLDIVRDNDNNSLTYSPVFTFAANDGNSYTVSSNISSNPPSFEVGENVRVLYEPKYPTRAKIGAFWQLWTMPVVFGILGTIASVVGFFLFRLEKRRNPNFRLICFRPVPHPSSNNPSATQA
jgi:hypothetical protein